MKLSALKSDLKREEDGDWIEIPELPGVSLKVRSLNSKAYTAALGLQSQKFVRKYGGRPVPLDESHVANGRLLARHILLDWKGLVDDDGQPTPFSQEFAETLLINPEFRKLANAIAWAAQRVAVVELE